MDYYISKTVAYGFAQTEERLRGLLAGEGFGILTEIDVQATLKKKLGVDFRQYKILGACNPPFAHEALRVESRIGLMLPCNVILQDAGEGKTEVAAVDPVASMAAVENEHLKPVAARIQSKLRSVIQKL
jgi:uncharacterized protein (DUF302 family)